MKKTLLAIAFAATAPFLFAQTTTSSTTTTTTSGSGTITEWSPGTSLVVKESRGPVTYKVRDKVTYVTKSGKTLTDDEARTRIKVGAPISVKYEKEGSDMYVNRIEVDDD